MPTALSPAAKQALHAQVRQAVGPHDVAAHQATLERRMRRYAVAQLVDLAVLIWAPWPALKVLTAVAFALYRTRTVWTIIHARVHAPPTAPTAASLFYDFCTGWIAWWWRRHHLAHHANTNTARDPDARLLLGRDLTRPGPATSGAGRGARLLGAVVQYPFFFVLFFARSLSAHRGAVWPFLLAMALYAALLSALLPPWEARLNTLANMGLGTLYIVFTFAPTHAAGPHNLALTGDRVADALISTNDVWPHSRAWSWLCGGINLHTAHHLYPHLPHEALPTISPLIADWAQAHGVPYHSSSPWRLWWQHLRFLATR